jgi:hypothetical protein
MSQPEKRPLSRRTLLHIAATGAGALWVGGGLAQASPALGLESARERQPDIEKHVGAIDAHAAAPPAAGFTDIAGIRDEYRKAIAAFPLLLPAGWVFPPESRLSEAEPGMQWERGAAAAEAYFFWQGAVVSEAEAAHARGDEASAARLLDSLEAGYRSSVRRAVLEDPDDGFLGGATRRGGPVHAARNGDFSALRQMSR